MSVCAWSPQCLISGVLSKKPQEDSQEVGCGFDWLSTMRATEEPFR